MPTGRDLVKVLLLRIAPATIDRRLAEDRAKLTLRGRSHTKPGTLLKGGQVVASQNATAAWLQAHPAGSGKVAIWSCFTDSSAGAIAAIKQAGRTDSIPIFTWDFNKEIEAAVESGQVAATLSLNGNAVGDQVASVIANYEKTYKAVGVAAVNTILTKNNVADFIKANPSSVQ